MSFHQKSNGGDVRLRFGLQGRAVLLCTVLIALTTTIPNGYLVYRSRTRVYERVSQRALTVARMLAHNCAAAVASDDPKALNRQVNELFPETDILSARIVDANGRLLAEYVGPSALTRSRSSASSQSSAADLAESCGRTASGDFDVRVPIRQPRIDVRSASSDAQAGTHNGDAVIGAVRLQWSTAAARTQLTLDLFDTLSLAAIVMGVGVLAATLAMRWLTSPVADLMETTRQIAGGNRSIRARENAVAELGVLARSFNAMADRVEDAYRRIEAEVAQRTRQLESANAQLIHASEMKSEFLANMSHEIRTPLNGIVGFVDLLLEEDLSSEQRDYVKTISQCSHSLLALINDILDLSKIEAGRLTVEQMDVHLPIMLDELKATIGHRAQEKGVEFRVTVDPRVPFTFRSDTTRLRQVLVNLTGNAVKFTSRGFVELRVSLRDAPPPHVAGQSGNLWLEFLVTDTGIGIPADRINAIFDPFVQADGSTTRQYGGTGLGLAISKRLLELLNGAIHVESEVGKGSRFSAFIPYKPADASLILDAPEPIRQPEPRPQKLVNGDLPESVLLVEDDETSAETIAKLLIRRGVTVYKHNRRHGSEALAAALRPSVVLLDLALPDGTGMEILQGLKQAEATANIPVLICSGGRDDGRAAAFGAAGFLLKPFSSESLYAALRQATGLEASTAIPAPLSVDSSPGSAPVVPAPHVTVFLVEDVIHNRKLMQRLLEKLGCNVVTAENGQEALDTLPEHAGQVALILMDMQMPVMNGYEASQRIKQNPEWRHIPVVALTAHAMSGDREKCLEAGCDDYLTKPVKRGALVEMMAKHIPQWRPPEPATADSAA